MSESTLQVEGLSKKFCRSLKRSLWYGVADLAGEVFLRPPSRDALRKQEFWALSDVSFELRRGETLGLIGHNGAGKSTLLKLCNGLIRPDTGVIRVRGRVGALIALGAGFSPVLTGRENIYVNAAVLGLSKREVDRRLDAIIGFAEVGEFIDAPLRTYSSGMKVRLGFSVASNLDPDILLIDEVLSVGDASFRARCLDRLARFKQSGGTIIFVSHNSAAVEKVSDRVLWLDHGRIRRLGEPADVIERYEADAQELSRQADVRLRGSAERAAGAVWLHEVSCCDAAGRPRTAFDFGEPFRVRVHYGSDGSARSPHFVLCLQKGARDAPFVSVMNTMWQGIDLGVLPKEGVVTCAVEAPSLAPGTYRVHVGVQARVSAKLGGKWYLPTAEEGSFVVRPGRLRDVYPGAPAAHLVSRIPGVVLSHSWSLDDRPLSPSADGPPSEETQP